MFRSIASRSLLLKIMFYLCLMAWVIFLIVLGIIFPVIAEYYDNKEMDKED